MNKDLRNYFKVDFLILLIYYSRYEKKIKILLDKILNL